MNVALLNRIRQHITEDPRRFFMGVFFALWDERWYTTSPFSDADEPDDELDDELDDEPEEAAAPMLPITPPACGTAACIAGWACLLGGDEELATNIRDFRSGWRTVEFRARDLLGLDESQARRLFYQGLWPTQFAVPAQRMSVGSAEYAQIACKRIDWMIKTGGE